MFKVTICDIGKMNINMTNKIEKKESSELCISHRCIHQGLRQKVVWFLQDGDTYIRRIGGKDKQGIRKNQSSLLSMEELFRYYLGNIIILRIGTGLRYLWLRFVRHRKISYRTLYEGSKSKKKATELSNFENEMSNRAWGCGFILFVIFLIIFLRRFL